ncbi:MAG: hypothetical protein HDR02_10575 [Lachnospiraceae bacterium]|nr:hypothetical protein [Lachnospiraceae bacterium]
MGKKILASFFAVGLLFSCVSARVDAQQESCLHQNQDIVITSTTEVGGYHHTYIAPGGTTKECAVTVVRYNYNSTCKDCGAEGSGTGTFDQHGTDHN